MIINVIKKIFSGGSQIHIVVEFSVQKRVVCVCMYAWHMHETHWERERVMDDSKRRCFVHILNKRREDKPATTTTKVMCISFIWFKGAA